MYSDSVMNFLMQGVFKFRMSKLQRRDTQTWIELLSEKGLYIIRDPNFHIFWLGPGFIQSAGVTYRMEMITSS